MVSPPLPMIKPTLLLGTLTCTCSPGGPNPRARPPGPPAEACFEHP